ncbi:hypothetical protein ABZ635_22620 [Nocardiopsis sp. NPDC007018]|uniref:hypothetical protein n=1 Tax=Nocardiopsis sp. NPDC007018 TaxID=3155721 RepID=UPI0033DE0072
MSLVWQVAATTGATRADVIRVATSGGSTQADWEIAVAIEAAGGRLASDLMFQPETSWRSDHTRLQNALWHETQPEDIEFLRYHANAAGITDIEPLLPAVIEEAPESTPTAPALAPDVTVYTEDAHTLVTDIPESRPRTPEEVDEDQAEEAAAGETAAAMFSDLAHVTDLDTARLATGWLTRGETHRAVRAALLMHPATSRRARYRARLQRHLATVA